MFEEKQGRYLKNKKYKEITHDAQLRSMVWNMKGFFEFSVVGVTIQRLQPFQRLGTLPYLVLSLC